MRALVVRQDAGINNVEDLRGKTVAAPFASTTHYHIMVALKLNNVDARQVHILNLNHVPSLLPETGVNLMSRLSGNRP